MKRLVTLFMVCLSLAVLGQPPMDRYEADLFSVTETNDILFSSSVPQPKKGGGWWEFVSGLPVNADERDTEDVDLYMDIFEPTGDTLTQRPLIIICFGGGFLSGSRDHWSIRLLCEGLAKRGYVTAAIDYRLGMNIFDADLANRSVYRGLQDGRAAVSFFRADAAGANNYKIDPDKIFIGGHSSGGFIATHNSYLDKEIERPISTGMWLQEGEVIPDLGQLDETALNSDYSGQANSFFSLAGAIGFLSFMESDEDRRVVMFHSQDDDTVPIDEGVPFSGVLWIVPNSDLPTVYGSAKMASRSDSIDLPYEFYEYTNRGHSVHENGSSSLFQNIIPDINNWFFEEELKPKYEFVSGNRIVCQSNLLESYQAIGEGGVYFDWQVIGGQLINNDNSEVVSVLWEEEESVHQLFVTPFSLLDAKGDEITLDITLSPYVINEYVGFDGQWSDVNNWSLGSVPQRCSDVKIGSQVILDVEFPSEINSLEITPMGYLSILDSQLWVNQKIHNSTSHSLILRGNLFNSGELKVQSINENKCILNDGGSLVNDGELYIK